MTSPVARTAEPRTILDDMTNGNYSMEDIERYVLDHMPLVEREEFGKQIAKDAQLQKEVERIHTILSEDSPPLGKEGNRIKELLKIHEAGLPPLTEEDLLNEETKDKLPSITEEVLNDETGD